MVSLFSVSGGVAVRIADDGVGLPPAGKATRGLGLEAMGERPARVGARWWDGGYQFGRWQTNLRGNDYGTYNVYS